MKKHIAVLISIAMSLLGFAQEQNHHPTQSPQRSEDAMVRISPPDGYINGCGYVDLGLPSGTKWAIYNVGASTPEGYGDYFAWGETIPNHTCETKYTRTYKKKTSKLRSLGIIDDRGNLSPKYDAARRSWGGSWRMPTKAECEELIKKCSWTPTYPKGINGYRVTGPNGKSLFFPCTGCRIGTTTFSNTEKYGSYWISTPGEDKYNAYILNFDGFSRCVRWFNRHYGFPIRPVSD